ncbi:MAG: alpha/beta hydrolase [Arachnia sp.]
MTTWSKDLLLASFQAVTLDLPDAPTYVGEPANSLCATLVRRNPPTRRRALLYIHGWNDYFFQTQLADEMAQLGYDFHALDLRRYGRSLRPGQLAGFVTDLSDYYEEIDEAVRIILDEGHDEIVVMGHSTGGLIAALWADERPGVATALVLNAPWLELQGYPAVRPALLPMFSAVRSLSPTAALPLSETGFYRRTISASEDGVWDYNLNLKGNKAFAVRVGWLTAIMQGQAKISAGLTIDVPVAVLLSDRSDFRRKWDEGLRLADIVLDVDTLAERAPNLGRHVTLIRIEGGMHDLALSDEPARSHYYAEVKRWLSVYGRGVQVEGTLKALH